MKAIATRLCLGGLIVFVSALASAEIHQVWVTRNDPPGWIMDRAFSSPLLIFLAIAGATSLILGTILWISAAIRNRISG